MSDIVTKCEVSIITKWEAFCFTKRGKWYYEVG